MSGTNGADLGQVVTMLNDVIAMQRETHLELAELKQNFRRLEARVDDLASRAASLRAEVASYPATVVGPGALSGELDVRVRHAEEHLSLPPAM